MPHFHWDCDLDDASPDQLLYVCADQLLLIEELLRKPEEHGDGEDFTLNAGAANGLATVVRSMARALRELGHRLGSTPVMKPEASQTGKPPRHGPYIPGAITAAMNRRLQQERDMPAPGEITQ
jgi:hypothetical protein